MSDKTIADKDAIEPGIMKKMDVLLLDEPTNGLDDNTVKDFWNIKEESDKL
ncbi:unknown [Clostridium sp. CAG:122]|nr:unknown [Clostridium sp. CAG:122]